VTRVWTHGTWVVRAGSEDAFVAAWTAFAASADPGLGGDRPTLARDRDRPNVFLSWGSWPSLDAVDAFRASPGFASFVEGVRPLLSSFEPMTLDDVEWT
jgi:quinol monooxygenase YgiN